MEESGWKNVHGDVFRPPQYPLILSSLLGSGIQLFCMVLIVICEFSLPSLPSRLDSVHLSLAHKVLFLSCIHMAKTLYKVKSGQKNVASVLIHFILQI